MNVVAKSLKPAPRDWPRGRALKLAGCSPNRFVGVIHSALGSFAWLAEESVEKGEVQHYTGLGQHQPPGINEHGLSRLLGWVIRGGSKGRAVLGGYAVWLIWSCT